MVASQGKVSEKSGNLDMDIEWQPCYTVVGCIFSGKLWLEDQSINYGVADYERRWLGWGV